MFAELQTAAFDGTKWKFYAGGISWFEAIPDEIFLGAVARGEVTVSSGDIYELRRRTFSKKVQVLRVFKATNVEYDLYRTAREVSQ